MLHAEPLVFKKSSDRLRISLHHELVPHACACETHSQPAAARKYFNAPHEEIFRNVSSLDLD
jgi:hypothetical protein